MIKYKSSFGDKTIQKGVTLMSDAKRVDTLLTQKTQDHPLKLICLIGERKLGKRTLLERAMRTLGNHFVVVSTKSRKSNVSKDERDGTNSNFSKGRILSDDLLAGKIFKSFEVIRKVGKIVILYDFPNTEEQARLLADEILDGNYFLEKVIVIRDPSNKNREFDRVEEGIMKVLIGDLEASLSEISEQNIICAQRHLNAILAEIAEI